MNFTAKDWKYIKGQKIATIEVSSSKYTSFNWANYIVNIDKIKYKIIKVIHLCSCQSSSDTITLDLVVVNHY